VIFAVFFVPLKQFLDYLELFLALKINSKGKEKKEKLSYRIGPSLMARPASAGPASMPAEAHLGPTGSQGLPGQVIAASIAGLGRRTRPGGRTSAPI
jgi:hypothetical protein